MTERMILKLTSLVHITQHFHEVLQVLFRSLAGAFRAFRILAV